MTTRRNIFDIVANQAASQAASQAAHNGRGNAACAVGSSPRAASPFAQLDKELERFFSGAFGVPSSTVPSAARTQAVSTLPISVTEREESLVIVAEVPGVNEDEVDVQLQGRVLELTINNVDDPQAQAEAEAEADTDTAEAPEESQGEQAQATAFAVPVRRYAVSRKFQLPAFVDVEGISAQLRNGVLAVVLPKQAKPEPRRIQLGR